MASDSRDIAAFVRVHVVSTGLRRTRVWGRVVRLDLPVYSDSGLGFGSGSGVGLDLGAGFGLVEKQCVPNPRAEPAYK